MKPRLLFIYLHPSPFVQDDLALLTADYEVRTFHFDARRARAPRGMLQLLWQQYRWLQRELEEATLILGWFADYHMVLPVRMARQRGRPVALMLGGFDCRCLRTLKDGVFCSPWRASMARYVYRHTTLLLPVTASLIEMPATAWTENRAQGVRVWVPALTTPFRVIPTGYDPEQWPLGPAQRAPMVRTVAFIDSLRVFRCKGIDLLLAAAARLPDVRFEVVGVTSEMQRVIREQYTLSPNVHLRSPVSRDALPAIYAETSVYAQLSRAEGLPNALCEAMLCGCIPVGSPVFGIPEAIGEVGFVVEKPDAEAVAAAIRAALACEPARRHQARNRIVQLFSRERRARELISTLEALRRS
ncbi:MAG: glycosyltransferase family 4 protein [Rhodothermus sp.]|nr:glycosyltransferase family 4 protein [Rhodothermus sp.]